MKIVHLISGGDVGGAKTHVLSLLHGLCRTEQAELICFMEGDFAAEARALGIPTTVLDGGFRSTLASLKSGLREKGWEVVHCHGSKANMFGMLLKGCSALPVVSTVHSDPRLDYLGRPLDNLTYGTINRISLRRMTNWIAVSDVTAQTLIRRGFDPQRVFTLYNGVDFTERDCAVGREDYLRSLGVRAEPDSVIFGIAARISPVKDMTTLVRAFAAAVRQRPALRLIIAGEGEQEAEIRALAAAECPEGSVTFAGWVRDTDSFYNALDVNLLTSVSEGFPYCLPEGARWHCPAISSAVGGVGRIVLDGATGLLFQPGDADALCAAMLKLADDPALRQRMGERIYERAKAEFSLQTMILRQREIYRTVLRRTERARRRRDGIMICGAYGKHNAGDDGILEAILRQIRALDPDVPVYVISRRPKETKMQFRVGAYHTFDLPGSLRRMRRTDVYISGGGSLIQDVTSSRSLLYYLYHISSARRRGNRVLMYGCGIGPVNRPGNRKKTARVINRYVDTITLRDALSREELTRLGVTRPEVQLTADPALLLPPPDPDFEQAYLHRCGFEEEREYAMISLRPWPGIEEKLPCIAKAADRLWCERGIEPVLFALEPRRDLPQLEALKKLLHCPARILAAPERWDELISVIRRMRAVISMRLHPLIFAAGQGIPTAGIVYDPKVNGFLEYLGSSLYLSVEQLDEQTVQTLFDRALESDGAAETRTAQLRALAAQNAQALAALLPGEKR